MSQTQEKPRVDVEVEPVLAYSPNPPDVEKLAPNRDERLFLVLSIFIGVISGLLVVCFRMAIGWFQVLTLGSAPHSGQFRLLFVPAAVGLLIGPLVTIVFPAARGSGVNQTKAALYIYNGFISFRTVIGKFITSALAIGGGFSLGPEDPSLQIGAGVASMISRRLRLSRERLRMFAPIGAAAGLAAAFNAPISAILFVVEEVIGNWSAAVLGSIVLAAVSSVVVARSFWGSQPMFRIPSASPQRPGDLFAYAALGVVGGGAALIFSKALAYLRPRLRQLPRWSLFCQPAVAGLAVGAIALLWISRGSWERDTVPSTKPCTANSHGSSCSHWPCSRFSPPPSRFPAALPAACSRLHSLLERCWVLPSGPSRRSSSLISWCRSVPMLWSGWVCCSPDFFGFPSHPSSWCSRSAATTALLCPSFSPIRSPIWFRGHCSRFLSLKPSLTRMDSICLPWRSSGRRAFSTSKTLCGRSPSLFSPARRALGKVLNEFSALEASALLIKLQDGSWYAMTRDELTSAAATTNAEAPLASVLKPERTPTLFPDLPLDSAIPYLSRWPVLPIQNRASRGTLEGMVTLEDVLRRYQRR